MRPRRCLQVLLAMMLATIGCKDTETGTPVAQEEMTPAAKLHAAAKAGNIEQVRSLIADGCRLDARDEHGSTPLHVAALFDHTHVVELLIAKGADVNAKDDVGQVPLDMTGLLEIAELLVAAGAHVAPDALYSSVRDDRPDVVRFLSARGAQVNPGDTRANRKLLLFAVRHQMRDFAEEILEAGANPDAVDRYWGTTALTAAVSNGDKEMTTLLIAHGADVNKPDDFHARPLSCVTSANKNVAELLLVHGADVNAGGVLRTAVERGDMVIVELLLAHGADASVKDFRGDTLLDEAMARGFQEIAALLRREMQNPVDTREQTER